MPTYDYSCAACGTDFEVFARFADYKPQASCVCGAVAERIYRTSGDVCVKGMGEYKFDPRKNVRPARGQSAAQAEKHYEKTVGRMLKQAREWNKSSAARSEGWEVEAIMPAPLADSVAAKEGDKNALLSDPIPFAKATGTYVGRD